ncbi:ABC transporter ATP-binding protein [Nanoarchaeota archaeon]
MAKKKEVKAVSSRKKNVVRAVKVRAKGMVVESQAEKKQEKNEDKKEEKKKGNKEDKKEKQEKNTDSLNFEIPIDKPLKDQPVVMVKSLSKSFKKKLVLKDVNFEVAEKDIFGVVGMSGSGKTTLFQMMAGVITQTSGDVLIRRDTIFAKDKPQRPDYVSVYKNLNRAKEKMGFASQIPSYYEHLTVEENLHLYGALYGLGRKKIKENAEKLMRQTGLEEDNETLASHLSGGMKRRMDIALALMHEPRILFLDEPTSDLDPVLRVQIWDLIKQINSQGTTIIIASHILEEIEQLCTQIAILHDKRIIGYGTLDELKNLFAKYQEVKIRLASGKYEGLMRKLKAQKFVIDKMFEKEGVLVVYTRRETKNLTSILKVIEKLNEKVMSLDISEAHLTEIFEMLAGR